MARQFHATVIARSLEQHSKVPRPGEELTLDSIVLPPKLPEAAKAQPGPVEQCAQEPINSDRTHQPLSQVAGIWSVCLCAACLRGSLVLIVPTRVRRQVIPLKSRAEYKKILSAFNARGGAKN